MKAGNAPGLIPSPCARHTLHREVGDLQAIHPGASPAMPLPLMPPLTPPPRPVALVSAYPNVSVVVASARQTDSQAQDYPPHTTRQATLKTGHWAPVGTAQNRLMAKGERLPRTRAADWGQFQGGFKAGRREGAAGQRLRQGQGGGGGGCRAAEHASKSQEPQNEAPPNDCPDALSLLRYASGGEAVTMPCAPPGGPGLWTLNALLC